MRCERCGYETHPGDQICIHCKAKLSFEHSFVPGIDKKIEPIDNEKIKKPVTNVLFYVLGIFAFVFAIVIILFLCFR